MSDKGEERISVPAGYAPVVKKLTGGFPPEVMLAKVKGHLEEFHCRRRRGDGPECGSTEYVQYFSRDEKNHIIPGRRVCAVCEDVSSSGPFRRVSEDAGIEIVLRPD
jgi:hypothetical protein